MDGTPTTPKALLNKSLDISIILCYHPITIKENNNNDQR